MPPGAVPERRRVDVGAVAWALGLWFIAGAFVSHLARERWDPGPADTLRTAIQVALAALVYGVVSVQLGRWLRRHGWPWRRYALVSLPWVLALASVVWSVYWPRTLMGAGRLGLLTAAAVYLSETNPARRWVPLVARALFATVVASWGFVALLPEVATMHHIPIGAWCGVYAHKTSLGVVCALSAALSVVWLAHERRRGWADLAAAGLAAATIAGTRSMTAGLCLAAGLLAWGLRRTVLRLSRAPWGPRRRLAAAAGAAALLAAAAGLGLGWRGVATALGRSPTLTGRSELWERVAAAVAERPWLGHGYDAFWHLQEHQRLRRLFEWDVWHSHNGYLEVSLETGVLGAGVLGVLLLALLRRAGRRLTPPGAAEGEAEADLVGDVAALLAGFMLAHNLTEVSWMRSAGPGGLLWLLVIAVLVAPAPPAATATPPAPR